MLCFFQVVSFIISDVIGDSLEMIASGPTVRQVRSPHRCLEIIDRLNAREALPKVVVEVLEAKKTQIVAQAGLSWNTRSETSSAGQLQHSARTHACSHSLSLSLSDTHSGMPARSFCLSLYLSISHSHGKLTTSVENDNFSFRWIDIVYTYTSYWRNVLE